MAKDMHTWQVTYTDPLGELHTELIDASYVRHLGQHVIFNDGVTNVFMIDQRAMHSARNVTVLDMTDDEIDKVEAVTDELSD